MKLYTLPPLPYEFGALEPYIDAKTMELHHDKHHQKYIDELNAALKLHPELADRSLEELIMYPDRLPQDVAAQIINNGGGHYNHTMFWTIMKPKSEGVAIGKLGEEIKKVFGSFAEFQEKFSTAAKKVFGSGWVWLALDKQGKLVIKSSANQDTPLLQGSKPVFGLDVWEHAYYLKYNNRRPDYIEAWWHVANWEEIENRYRALIG